jgi:hypothetical protein
LPHRPKRLYFTAGGIGKVGWLGKDAGPGIQLSKSAIAAGKAGGTRGTKRCLSIIGATCAFESKKVHHEGHEEHEGKS